MIAPARHRVLFRPGQELKKAINGKRENTDNNV
jgi:nucleoid DNA-binding protein